MSDNKKMRRRQRRAARNARTGYQQAIKPHTMVSLKYPSQALTITEAAAGAGTSYSFAVNSVFDPDFTGAGNQPIGYDQWSQFYGRYRVKALRYKIYMMNVIGTANAQCVAGVYFSPQSTLPANPTAWLAQPSLGSPSKTVVLSSYGGGQDVKTLTGSVNLSDLFGVTPGEYANEMDFAATTGGSPARLGYMHIWVLGSSNAAVLRFHVILDYHTELSQPVALSVS